MSAREQAAPPEVILVGGSAGAIEALSTLLPRLGPRMPAPVLVVVHLLPNEPSLLARLFAASCAITVVEAEDKMPLAPATIVFAPPDYHLLVEAGGTLALSVEPPSHFSRPSIDVLFESAADALGPRVLAIVLTGASANGAAGLAAVERAGGVVVVQDPETAAARTAPDAAIAAVSAPMVLSLDGIEELLTRLQPSEVGRGA